jgi:uncharacterized protein YabE (DUF348 family)
VALPAVALAGVVAPTLAFTGMNNSVTLTVDGQTRSVRTFADNVAGVLDRADVTVGRHGTVSPGRHASVHDGSRIVVRHGRPLTLTLDGDTRTAWVTARQVRRALDQLDISAAGAYVSKPRSRAIPRSGMDLTVRLPQQVFLVTGGRLRAVTTTAPTVRRLLVNQHVAVDGTDLVSPSLAAYPTAGMVVHDVDVAVRRRTHRVTVPFDTVRRRDSSRYKGDSAVVQAGHAGVRTVTKKVTFHDGKKVATKALRTKLVRKPTDKIVDVGTKARPAPKPAPAPAAAPARHSTGSGGLDWAALARCESGGNPRAVSPGGSYRGLYQFTFGTWHSVGGSGDPINASAAEQTRRAEILYGRTGSSSWPACGHNL